MEADNDAHHDPPLRGRGTLTRVGCARAAQRACGHLQASTRDCANFLHDAREGSAGIGRFGYPHFLPGTGTQSFRPHTDRSAYAAAVIVSMHVATGAAGGAFAGSRLRAALLGLVLHGICDRIPHWDIASPRFEVRSGLALLGALAAARGPFDPAVVGAAASSAPDLEHAPPLPKLGAGRRSTRPIVSPAGTGAEVCRSVCSSSPPASS